MNHHDDPEVVAAAVASAALGALAQEALDGSHRSWGGQGLLLAPAWR